MRLATFALPPLALGLVLLGAPSRSSACGPPIPPVSPACNAITVASWGYRAPINHPIRPALEAVVHENGEVTRYPGDWTVDLVLEREDETGWTEVDFNLLATEQEGRYRLEILEPVPGHYVLSWSDETCGAPPSPSGAGPMVMELELLPEAPIPTELGAIVDVRSELVSRDVQQGVDGMCEPIIASVVDQSTQVDLALDEAMRPWTGVMRFSLVVDGREESPISRSEIGEDLIVSLSYQHRCSASDENLSLGRLEEGVHQVQVRGEIRGGEELVYLSEITEMEIRCDDAPDAPSTTDDPAAVASGCSAAPHGGSSSGALFALPLLALLFVRKR